MQMGDADGAAQCFDESVRVARDEAATYELALSLDARARLRARVENEPGPDAQEARQLLQSLGVVSVPEIPLPPIGTG
jgi:hypothetical protein